MKGSLNSDVVGYCFSGSGRVQISKKLVVFPRVSDSDVFGEQKSGVMSGSGSAFRGWVGFGDQHFGDVPLGVSGIFKVKFRIG